MLPASVEHLRGRAFENCTALTSVVLNEGLKTVGHHAFEGCYALNFVAFPGSIQDYGQGCLRNCVGLKSVKLPKGMKAIPNEMFSGCKCLELFDFPDTTQTIENRAFKGCEALISIRIPPSVREIKEYAFSGSGLEEVSIPSGVILGEGSFADCKSLQKLILPEDLETIPNLCFNGCIKLLIIDVPDSVTTIGYEVKAENARLGLNHPKSIKFLKRPTPPRCAYDDFYDYDEPEPTLESELGEDGAFDFWLNTSQW